MQAAPEHPQEKRRIAALLRYEILDSEAEQCFDELTELAQSICNTPICLISLIDRDRQWFKSRQGLDVSETSRSLAFCAHAILQEQVFEVENALDDPRFADNPLVSGDPNIRFYAGAPLMDPLGNPLGTLCVIDRERRQLNDSQRRALQILAKQVIGQLELRLQNRVLQRVSAMQERMFAVISHNLRSPFNGILGLSQLLNERANHSSPERIVDISEKILVSAGSTYQVLDELLSWSKRKFEKIGYIPSVISLNEQIKEAREFLRVAMKQKNVSLSLHNSENTLVLADPVILKTVLRNLLSNALNASSTGAILQIDVIRKGVNLEVGVFNPGESMQESEWAKYLDNRNTAVLEENAESERGFGLLMCKDLLALQGNSMHLDTSCDQGTRIAFDLLSA